MPRVIGIDPGTVSIDLCGLEDGRLFLDRSIPTSDALADPARFVRLLEDAGPVDLVAGPSGYGLPLTRARDATDGDLRLALLGPPGEAGGIGGLGALLRALARSRLPVVLRPGVLHLPTVPAHRKVNRVDMGTADKVCAVALAVVDGAGGCAGALGRRGAGALDGEVAFLAGRVSKDMLFRGGVATVAGWEEGTDPVERLAHPTTPRERIASEALIESTVKTAVALALSVPGPAEFVLSGRLAHVAAVSAAIRQRLDPLSSTRVLDGFAAVAKQAAQGAALLADGLAGGAQRELVELLAIREARGSVLDHLYVVPREQALRRLGGELA